jgi:hypothetical protein
MVTVEFFGKENGGRKAQAVRRIIAHKTVAVATIIFLFFLGSYSFIIYTGKLAGASAFLEGTLERVGVEAVEPGK